MVYIRIFLYATFLEKCIRKERMWKEEDAQKEATDNRVLLKKIGRKFGRNTWKRS